MPKSRRHFDEFEPHSRHKHAILEAYFESWGRKLLLRRGAGSVLCYVDACAGRGMDDVGNRGSPVIAARAAAMAEGQLAERFGVHATIRVIAIEKKRDNFRALAANLAPFGERARALRGTLAEHFDAIDEEFRDTPTLFFIDPFGLEPLHADLVRRALHGPKNEALLLFADQAALRHFGAAISEETARERALRRHDEAPSLFDEQHAAERGELAMDAERSRQARELTRETAIRILDAAFDGRAWLAEIEAAEPEARRIRFLELYRRLLARFGAPYVVLIPVLKEDGTHVYHLVHASKSPKARRTMKEAVEHAINHSPLPNDVRARLRDQVRVPLEPVIERAYARFAGQTVRWAEDAEDRTRVCVRNWVLEETDMFPSWLPELRKRLEPLRDRAAGRTVLYRFPPAN